MGRQLNYVNNKKGVNSTFRASYQIALSLFRKAKISLSQFINTHAYKLLELCHDSHIAGDEQITPLYSLRSRYLTTFIKSTRIKESEAVWLRMLQALKYIHAMLLFSLQQRLCFVLFQLQTLLVPLELNLSYFLSVCFCCKHFHSTINVIASMQ